VGFAPAYLRKNRVRYFRLIAKGLTEGDGHHYGKMGRSCLARILVLEKSIALRATFSDSLLESGRDGCGRPS
jgi:hypothetical protein